MIRKVCIALVVVLAAMVGLKVALAIKAKKSARPAAKVVRAADAKADLAPTVYYTRWIPYAVENETSHRNGYLLDLVRAIFPKAKFVRVFRDDHGFADVLSADPNGISVMYGDHPKLSRFPKAPTPVFELDMVVYTLRTNTWRFVGGPEALAKFRLGFTEDYLDVKMLREHAQKHPDRVRIYKAGDPNYDNIAAEVLAGNIDGFAVSKGDVADARQIGMAAERMIEFRQSKPIAKGAALFMTSDKDPALSKRLIDSYEKGRKIIEESGELRRLREYYGIGETK